MRPRRSTRLTKKPTDQDYIPSEDDSESKDEDAESVASNVTSEAGPSTNMYFDYDPTIFQSLVRYRTHSDIVSNVIVRSQSDGVDRYEIGKYLSVNCKTKAGNRRVSTLIQQLAKNYPDDISQFQKMEGKYRISKYFYKGGESTPSSFLELLDRLEKLLGHEFPYSCSDIVQFPGKKLCESIHLQTSMRISDITLRRFVFILEFLKEENDAIVLIWRLSRYISRRESDLGYQFAIDKKSVLKCLYALEQKQIIRLFKVDESGKEQSTPSGKNPANEDNESSAQFIVITSYDIQNSSDIRIKTAIDRVIEELQAEGRIFPTGQYAAYKREASPIATTSTVSPPTRKRQKMRHHGDNDNLVTVEERYEHLRHSFDLNRKRTNSASSTASDEDSDSSQPSNDDFDYGCQSKFIRCAVLHEFIYHIIYEMNQKAPSLYERFPLDKHLPLNTECTSPKNIPELDKDQDNPYRHVLRIPPFKNAQRGWFLVRDVLLGMPLSIYVLLVRQKRQIEGLQELLDEPERRHTLLADLPYDLRKKLFNRPSALVIEHLCQLLSAIGLMRVAPPFQDKINVMGPHALFFIGKKAFFYDTSTSGRGYALVIPPITQYKRYDYHFESMEQVLQYWNHLKAVCWSTSLGARHIPEGQENFKSDSRKYAMSVVDRSPFTFDYAEEIDEISPVGTFDGCAGFDAQLFSHLQRNWEFRAQPNSSSTHWFLKRWQHTSARLSSYVSERVSRLENNWNSYISSFLPNDMDMIKKKKSDLPILTTKTLSSLGGAFRRVSGTRGPSNTKRVVPAKKNSMTSLLDTIQRSGFIPSEDVQQASTSSQAAKTSVKKKKKKGPEREIDKMGIDNGQSISSQKRGGAKRKLDQTDIESLKSNMSMRSRFSTNEYDMESRTKTVSSLLAASAREMLRPGRNAQLQYIVKTFSGDKKMIEIRDVLANQCKTDDDKSRIFWQAFTAGHKLIFYEPDQVPDATVGDAEFRKYLARKKMTITVADNAPNSNFPRRSRKPETLEDVQHCVAYNVVMSTLISEAVRNEEDTNSEGTNAFRSDFLVNSISPTALSETLEVCRGDGLISRVRNTEAKTYLVKNQVTISTGFRSVFNHFYRKDLIDLLKDSFSAQRKSNKNITDDDNPAALVRMIEVVYNRDRPFDINLTHLIDLIDCNIKNPEFDDSGKEMKNATKNIRQLENAPMLLNKIGIRIPQVESLIKVPSRDRILPIICPVYDSKSIENPDELKRSLCASIEEDPMLKGRITFSKALGVLDVIRATGFNGASFEELKGKTKTKDKELHRLLNLFANINAAFPCGVDVKRYVSAEHSQVWFIKTDTNRFSARPWTLPNGSVNWSILRWMSESILLTVLTKPGILTDELYITFSYALSPVLVRELIDFLIELGCCIVETRKFESCKEESPFGTDQRSAESIEFVSLLPEALDKFAIFFADTPLPKQLLNQEFNKA